MNKIVQPVIHDYLTQILCKHYNMEPMPGAKAALRLIQLLELYKMEIIIGEWLVPEPLPIPAYVPPKRISVWDQIALDLEDIETSGREPWLAKEIQ